VHTQRNSTGESIPLELSILRSGSPIDCDLLLSYPSYPPLSLDGPEKEPLKLSLIEKLVEGNFVSRNPRQCPHSMVMLLLEI
jgi:hypothetical protein